MRCISFLLTLPAGADCRRNLDIKSMRFKNVGWRKTAAYGETRSTDEMKALHMLLLSLHPALPMTSRRRLHMLDEASSESETPRRVSDLSEFMDLQGQTKIIKEAYKQRIAVQPPTSKQASKNKKLREQKFGSQVLQTYSSGISMTLKQHLKTFRGIMRHLPVFQAQLANLTFAAYKRNYGDLTLEDIENDFDEVRRGVVRAGKEAIAKVANASTVFEAKSFTEEGLESIRATFEGDSEKYNNFCRMVRQLRSLPRPNQDEPIIVLVGMPNVGKSSLVTVTSSGQPEINAYPFTTINLKVGHIMKDNTRIQVMDTPGILSRAEARNPMEGLTLAAVEHLPSAVMYIMDLSGLSGEQSSPQLQLAVRDQVRAQYPDRPWLDVRTKADLPLAEGVDAALIPEGSLEVSAVEGINIDVLKRRMEELASQSDGLRMEHSSSQSSR